MNSLRAGRRLLTAFSLLLVPVALCADATLERLLKLAPDDAALAVAVPSLEKFGEGLTAYGKAGKIEFLKDMSGKHLLEAINFPYLAEGIDLSGSLLAAGGVNDAKPLVAMGIKDVAAWKKATNAEDAGEGLLKLKIDEQELWATLRDNIAILAEDKDQLGDALKTTGKFAKRFEGLEIPDKAQLVLYADVPQWKTDLGAALDSIGMVAQMGAASSGPDAEMGLAMIKGGLDKIRQLVADTDRFVLAGQFDSDGARFATSAGFLESSEAVKYLHGVERVDADILRGLPDRPAMIVVAGEWKDATGSSIMAELGRTFMQGVAKTDESRKKVEDALDKWMAIAKHVTGYNMSLEVVDAHVAIAGEYLSTNTSDVFKGIADSMRAAAPIYEELKLGMTMTMAEEKLGGADAVVGKFKVTEDSPTAGQLETVWGKDLSYLLAPAKDGVAFAVATDATSRKMAAAIVEGKAPPLSGSKPVRSVLEKMTPKPHGLLLVDVGELVRGGLAVAKSMGVPPAPIHPPTGAIAGFGVYLNKSSVTLEINVPSNVAKAIVEMIDQANAPPTEKPAAEQ